MSSSARVVPRKGEWHAHSARVTWVRCFLGEVHGRDARATFLRNAGSERHAGCEQALHLLNRCGFRVNAQYGLST